MCQDFLQSPDLVLQEITFPFLGQRSGTCYQVNAMLPQNVFLIYLTAVLLTAVSCPFPYKVFNITYYYDSNELWRVIKIIMIQNQGNPQLGDKQQQEITKQIIQYKKINASLRKKIHERDKKINSLLVQAEQISKSTISYALQKNKSQMEYSSKLKKEVCVTEPKNKQKQNIKVNYQNIFKDYPIEEQETTFRQNLKLPVLERKSIFKKSQQTQSKPRIIKIPIDKLVPLRPEDVRRKFESKFK